MSDGSDQLLLISEFAGRSLQGVINGSNRFFQTTYDWHDLSLVSVYINGRRKRADWADGFVLHPPRTIETREALLGPKPGFADDGGDTLEVEYTIVRQIIAGGQLGGVPGLVVHGLLEPILTAHHNVPALTSGSTSPSMTSGDYRPTLVSGTFKPTIIVGSGD